MLTLGIETSGRPGSVALCRDGVCLDERPLEQQGRRHAQSLVAEIDRLLRQFECRGADCELVAVSIGPGSFTGLRVGVVCAKTVCYAAGCRLAAVDTFLCVAENSPADVDNVYVVGDAQRGELFAGRYARHANGFWTQTEEIAIVNGETWCRARNPGDVVTGTGVEKFKQELSTNCRVLKTEYRSPLATVVARLGERKLETGTGDDLWSLEPLYLRRSAAEEKRDAAARQNRGSG